MNKPFAALIASAFAFVSMSASAQAPSTQPVPMTMVPLSQLSVDQAKAAREAAKEKWDAMTPEQQAAARKKMKNKRMQDLSAMDEYVVKTEGAQYDAKAGAAAAAASKAQATPTKTQRQKDLTKAEDAAAKASGSKSGVPTQ